MQQLIILTRQNRYSVAKLCKILHSLRQDILRPDLTIGRHVSFEIETRPETFETETRKIGFETSLRGVEAGKFLGVRRIFVRTYSNLRENFVSK